MQGKFQFRRECKRVGRFIRDARKAEKVSQVKLAKLLGVSQSAVSKIESGRLIPDMLQWMRFCDHFGYSYKAFESELEVQPQQEIELKAA